MKNFVTEVAINNHVLEFCFMRMAAKVGKHYHITVADQDLNLYAFLMAFHNDQWAIKDVQQLPPWIQRSEFILRNAILANEG